MMKYLILYVKSETWTALFYVNYLSFFATVKLKLRHNLSQFTHRFKCRFFWVFFSGWTSNFFSQFTKDFWIFGCCSSWTFISWINTNLFANALLCLDFLQYAIILFQSLINEDFLYFWDRPWYSDECASRLHYIPYLGNLDFVYLLSQAKAFYSGAVLKIAPSFHSMEEFGLDIQK